MHKFSRYNKPKNVKGFWWHTLDCFHVVESREHAESLLRNRPEETFLIREFKNDPTLLVISIKTKSQIVHYLAPKDTVGDFIFNQHPNALPLVSNLAKSLRSYNEELLNVYINNTVTSFFKVKGIQTPNVGCQVKIGKKEAHALALTCKQISAEANAAYESAILNHSPFTR